MDNQKNRKAAEAFAAAFAKSVAEAMGEAAGSPWLLGVAESPEPLDRKGQPIHFRLLVDGGLRGECFVEFYEPPISGLTSKILGRTTEPFNDAHGEALAKVLSSATAGIGAALAGEYGEMTFKVERVGGLAFGGMFVVPLAAPAEPSGGPVLLYFDGQLLASLSAGPGGRDALEAERAALNANNLKLVMDVELNVSLRFGQRQLPLREVLELASGSVIELDRMVDEPVELLLDGKLIARGEAVIVDGNYGLRVTEIPQPVASHFIR